MLGTIVNTTTILAGSVIGSVFKKGIKEKHQAALFTAMGMAATGLGINHSLAHQLGAQFHIPHGRANAMLLPHVIEFNSGIGHYSRTQKEYLPSVERYASAAHVLGLSSYNPVMGVRSLINWTQFMNSEMGIPAKISEMGTIEPAQYFSVIDEMAENALRDSCTATNPRDVTAQDLKEILIKLW